MDNIILIGFMGCGKSTIGKALAKKINYTFVDTDLYIEEKEQMKISDIFAQKGEEYFRKLETEVLEHFLEQKNIIIATGGGLPLAIENQDILKKQSNVFYLKASPETIFLHVAGDNTRPLLQVSNPKKKIIELLQFRTPIYEKEANYILSVDHKKVKEIVAEMLVYIS